MAKKIQEKTEKKADKKERENYRFLEGLTYADHAFEAFGKTLSELFENAGTALCATQAELSSITSSEQRKVNLTRPDAEQLLFDFLEELVFIKDAERFLCKEIKAKVTTVTQGYRVSAVFYGEEINQNKHILHNDIKSVTYHLFKVERVDDEWRAQVLLDV